MRQDCITRSVAGCPELYPSARPTVHVPRSARRPSKKSWSPPESKAPGESVIPGAANASVIVAGWSRAAGGRLQTPRTSRPFLLRGVRSFPRCRRTQHVSGGVRATGRDEESANTETLGRGRVPVQRELVPILRETPTAGPCRTVAPGRENARGSGQSPPGMLADCLPTTFGANARTCASFLVGSPAHTRAGLRGPPVDAPSRPSPWLRKKRLPPSSARALSPSNQ